MVDGFYVFIFVVGCCGLYYVGRHENSFSVIAES